MSKHVIIGVTGSLASGKTTVTNMFAKKGCEKIDADSLAHKLLAEDRKIIKRIVDLFGKEVVAEGRIDHRKLAKVVFYNKNKLKKLCNILHPEIIKNIKRRVKESSKRIVVIDAPLLIEAGLDKYVDNIIVIRCTHDTQLKRAKERGINIEEARRIIANQMPLSRKIRFADYIIDSERSLKKVKEGVNRIWEKIK